MSSKADIVLDDKGAPIIVIAKAWTLRFYVTTGDRIVVTADALLSATTILVQALKTALTSGDKVRFGNLVVTLTANAVIGATSLTVTAIAGALTTGSSGHKVQDISGWAIEWVLRDEDGTALLTKTVGSGITLTDATNGAFDVLGTRADTWASGAALISPSTYEHAAARTDSGSETALVGGIAKVFELASR